MSQSQSQGKLYIVGIGPGSVDHLTKKAEKVLIESEYVIGNGTYIDQIAGVVKDAEIIRSGTDISLVTYGSCVRIAREAADQLNEFGISVEIIDVQCLIPFDLPATILESVRKTGRVVFFDEDVPGGATAYMMQKVLEEYVKYLIGDSSG